MDPSESGPWETLSDDEHHLYRSAIQGLLMRPDLFFAALPLPDHNSIERRAKICEWPDIDDQELLLRGRKRARISRCIGVHAMEMQPVQRGYRF